MTVDTLKVSIFEEVMHLSQEQLQKVYDYIISLDLKGEKEYTMSSTLLQSALDYTKRVAEEDGPLYSTEDAFNQVDKRLGWKQFGRNTPLKVYSRSCPLQKASGEKKKRMRFAFKYKKKSLYQRNILKIGTRFAGKESYLSDIRTLLVKKKNKIFYTLIENKVYILLVWDVRQDPGVLETLLNQYLKQKLVRRLRGYWVRRFRFIFY